MKDLICISSLLVLAILLSCTKEEERKIKLTAQPIEALAQERVETIQIAAEEKKKVAILYFDNGTRNEDLGWMSQGLVEMLALDMAQSRQLNLLTSRNVEDALQKTGLRSQDIRNADNTQILADALEAEAVVNGRYYFEQDSLRIHFELRDGRTGQVLDTHSGSSPNLELENIFALIDNVSGIFRSKLEEKLRDVHEEDRSLAEVTTTSFEAYKHYSQAIKDMESFYFEQASQHLIRAIELDSTFASAYYQLTATTVMLSSLEEAQPYLEKAVKYSEDLPERERLPIMALYARLNGNFYKSIELLNDYVTLFPEDDDAHYQLGEFYFGVVSNYEKAIENFESTVLLNPQHKMAYNHLAYSYAFIGKMEHAYDALDKYLSLAKDEPNPYDSYGEILQRAGRIKEAIKLYKQALEIRPEFFHSQWHLASAYLDLGKTRKARNLLTDMLEAAELKHVELRTLDMLALTEGLAGNLQKAEEYINLYYEREPQSTHAIASALFIDPDSPEYRQRFLRLVQEYKENPDLLTAKSASIFRLVSLALDYNLALDQVEGLLDMVIESGQDPVLFQSAIAFKLILDFSKGEDIQQTEALFEESVEPTLFQYASPASWNYYWKHYFASLEMAHNNGEDIRPWTTGFAEFAARTENNHYEISSELALAAAEFIVGNSDSARTMLHKLGTPCEAVWKVIGPFDVNKGFHQTFWPEERHVGEWLSEAQENNVIIQKRDKLFDGYVNLKEISSARFNQAVYALLQINSPTVKKMQIHFGMNGKLKVWLNDENVLTRNEREHAYVDRYTASVRLRPGANWLLVRLSTGIDELGFYFRLTDQDGIPDSSVQFGPTVNITRDQLEEMIQDTEGA